MEQTCREECSDDDGELIAELINYRCGKCEKKKSRDLDEYTVKILNLRQLKKAGYPFGANDLTLEEWLDLGLVEETMEWQTKAPSP